MKRARVLAVLIPAGFAAPAQAQPWVARHGLTPAQYQTAFDDLATAGYRLLAVSGYVTNGAERYAALWEKKEGPAWIARHGLTAAEYQQQFNELVAQGYRLTYVSAHWFGGQDRYASIWTRQAGPVWAAHHGLTTAQYQQTFGDLRQQGYRLTHVSSHGSGNTVRSAAIFEKSAGPEWVARHGLSTAAYQQAFDQFTKQGFRLKTVSGYHVGGNDRYAATGRRAPARPGSRATGRLMRGTRTSSITTRTRATGRYSSARSGRARTGG